MMMETPSFKTMKTNQFQKLNILEVTNDEREISARIFTSEHGNSMIHEDKSGGASANNDEQRKSMT